MINQTNIIAHRGASFDAPENTLEAVQLAWQQNADAVEIDVMLSKDGQIVVFHDEDTSRMTGESGLAKDKTWLELQRLEINSKGYKARIPLLRDIFPTIPADKFLVVEIKCSTDIILPLRELITEFKISPKNVQFISLDEQIMHQVLQQFPGYETQRVFEFDVEKPDVDLLTEYANQTPFNGIDLEIGEYITDAFVQRIHQLNKKIYVWTVNELQQAERLVKMGIDGITTDHPGSLRNELEALS